MRDHTKLQAFELAEEVAVLIYRATRGFPREEIYGLRVRPNTFDFWKSPSVP